MHIKIFKLKFLILCSFLLLFISGCVSTKKIVKHAVSIIKPISKEKEYEILKNVNRDKEIYGLGVIALLDTGIKYSNAKALNIAKDKLRKEMIEEISSHFKEYTVEMDSKTRKKYTDNIPDLVEYTVDSQMYEIEEKGYWDDEERAYALVTIKKDKIEKTAKKVYSSYMKELNGKID